MTVGGRNAGSNYQNTILPSPLQLSFPVADIDIVGDLAWGDSGHRRDADRRRRVRDDGIVKVLDFLRDHSIQLVEARNDGTKLAADQNHPGRRQVEISPTRAN